MTNRFKLWKKKETSIDVGSFSKWLYYFRIYLWWNESDNQADYDMDYKEFDYNCDRYKILQLIVNDPNFICINREVGASWSGPTALAAACRTALPFPFIKLLCQTKYGPKKDIQIQIE